MSRIRCAVYTRKSTDEGLDQEFNSLDAQREACEAYILSQRGEGWLVTPKRYDDGGISGGTMERPALQALMSDIERGKVDLVVVYKVDRLTRSLSDFSKIVDVFDESQVSFVSVTQQFNTATSMGRLTLNMLLSFAQFEREVTAERIRDKIAASKQKGMWMGGQPPLGYDAVDKKLVVNESEASTVRLLFDQYRELRSIRLLKEYADQNGIVTKVRQRGEQQLGGKSFTRGHLSQLLHNPIYVGDILHKGSVYPGQHDAIVSRETWEAVQQVLDAQAPARDRPGNTDNRSLLTGLIYDETGDRLTPTYAKKGTRTYRYYISKRLVGRTNDSDDGWRLPAKEIETAVIRAIIGQLGDSSWWIKNVPASVSTANSIEQLRQDLGHRAEALQSDDRSTQRSALNELLSNVVVGPAELGISFRASAFSIDEVENIEGSGPILKVPFQTKRRGVERKLVIGDQQTVPTNPDEKLIGAVLQAHEWLALLSSGEEWSIDKLAKYSTVDPSTVTRLLPLAFLAPNITEAILGGTQPIDFTLEELKKLGPLPLAWVEQNRCLGFISKSGAD